ncbi:MAG: DUF3369 domain-containing protein [Gammaproteobacteria bacterium]|nr:DUF3369 domain-containing protein [Gammaproteobacteria bacterium]
MNDDDELIFLEEDDTESTSSKAENNLEPWIVAIIDDEEQIHHITKLALGHFRFNNRPLQFLDAYSGKEGIELFKNNNNIAVCLLDVVMETEHAGLDLVKEVRELGNDFTRIVLRTGQPGQAPEEKIITTYDINDYKEKTELTRNKLVTLMHSCLKTYEYILNQEQMRIGLENVIQASTHVLSQTYLEQFVLGVLTQMNSLFNFGRDSALISTPQGFAAHENNQQLSIIAGTGDFQSHTKPVQIEDIIPEELCQKILLQEKQFEVFYDDHFFISSYMTKRNSREILLFSGNIKAYQPFQFHLVNVFCHNTLIALENIFLKSEVEDAHSEMVFMLGEAVETRSKETGYHLRRVAELSYILAKNLGMDELFCELIKQAAPLHDIGKIAIPDAILNKPGKLNEEEWEIMKTHVSSGYNMLSKSSKHIMQVAALICRDHHERWDGKGYPRGLSEQNISVEGRITAVADVFDALATKRCYKEAWSIDDVFEYFQSANGTQFEPALVTILFDNKEEILSIYDKYQEQ